MADLASLVGWAFLAMLLNAADVAALFYSIYFSMKTNTVAAWILFVVAVVVLQPLAYYCGLGITWYIAFLILDVIAFIILILASVRACNNTGSCCTTDGDCKDKKKKKGCNMGCMSSCCDSNCCDSDCCDCNDDCDDDDDHKHKHKKNKNPCGHSDCPSDKCNRRSKKPTHSGGDKVQYHKNK